MPAMLCALSRPANAQIPSTLDDLIEEAIRANPEIEMMDRRVAVLEAEAGAARQWPDPVLSAEYSSVPWNSWSLGESPMSGVQVKISQRIVLPGKNRSREEAAMARTAVAEIRKLEAEMRLRATVRKAFYRLVRIRGLARLATERLDSIRSLSRLVRERYELGRGTQHDVLGMELLAARLEDEIEDYIRDDDRVEAALNEAMGRGRSAPIATPARLEAVLPKIELGELVALAKRERPAIRAHQMSARAQRLAARASRWERRPDISVWVGYRFRAAAGMDDGTDLVTLGASIPIPMDLEGTRAAQHRSHLESAMEAERAGEVELNRVAAQLEGMLAAWRRAASKARKYEEEIISLAAQSLAAAENAYETGAADVAQIYRAELEMIEVERGGFLARVETNILAAEVEELVGADPSRVEAEDGPAGRVR